MATPLRSWHRPTGATTGPVPAAEMSAAELDEHEPERDEENFPDPWAGVAATRSVPASPQRGLTTPRSNREAPAAERKHVDYRMDPAPVWGGDSPEKHYKEYLRNLQLWLVEAEARIPLNLIGKRIIDSIPLGSKLSTLLAHLTVAEITAPEGYKAIIKIIEDAHGYLKDQSLEQAFDEAIFRGRRDRGQSLTAFLAAKTAAFAELRKQGLDLLATSAGRHLLGHLILRQGGFTMDQKQRLRVVTNGSIDYRDLEGAIQRVLGDKIDEPGHDGASTTRRWRSSTYWDGDASEWNEDDEHQTFFDYDLEVDDLDIFQDLVALNDTEEVVMSFPTEVPMVMEENETLEVLASTIEDVFYETRERLAFKGKGKGKGKKGKSKGGARTFGEAAFPAFGGGKGGGYLDHRRALQASRNGRGYDRPWNQRFGSKLTLSELKAKTRCHQCKQVGHWSRECPQKGKIISGSRSSTSGASSNGSMSTGFFVEPPKTMASFGHQFLTATALDSVREEYMQRPHPASNMSFLSYVFLGSSTADGTALVDTAAQHGLVGMQTLEKHDHLLQERFGLKVQWSHEAGGSVRGVCGAEETTKIAYVPIGLSGKSGVLRVQVVPGDIPFLLPAYFLTELGAVIDMKNATIFYTELGVKQLMKRLTTGHVSVSIVEFGDGFCVPANFSGTRSSAWSQKTVPDWSTANLPDGLCTGAMGPLASLVAALLWINGDPSMAGDVRSDPNTTTSRCSAVATSPRNAGRADLQDPAAGAASACHYSDVELYGTTYGISEHFKEGRPSTTVGGDSWQGQVPGSKVGAITSMSSQPDQAWSKQQGQLEEVPGLQTGGVNAFDTNLRDDTLEQRPGLHAPRLHQADDCHASSQGTSGRTRSGESWCQAQVPSSAITPWLFRRSSTRNHSHWQRDGRLSGDPGGHGCDYDSSTIGTDLRSVSWRPAATASAPTDPVSLLGLQQSKMCTVPGEQDRCGAGSRSVSLLQLPGRRDDPHQHHFEPRRDRAGVQEVWSSGLHLRAATGLLEDGEVQGGPVDVKSGWLQDVAKHYELDETFYQIVETLDVDWNQTYVAIGYGDDVKGVMPVVTKPIISRRIILTKCGDVPWCAVDVTTVPGTDYHFGCGVNYLVLYEFMTEFLDYLVDTEFEHETTLPRSSKIEISNRIDEMVGDLTTYWTLWEGHSDEPDDVVEVFGNFMDKKDVVVEIYSPPRVVETAAARGLQASLSVDLATGYDLRKPEDRERVREEVRKRRPRLVVTTPPCTKFSLLQNLRQYPERLAGELDEAILHVDFSMDLLDDQRCRGDHGLHEHPETATSWRLPKVINYLSQDEVVMVKSHLCRFGLVINGHLSRKATLFATTCDAIAINLQKLCECTEPHQQLISGLPKLAQVYPPQLVNAIIDGLLQDWIDQQKGRPKKMPDLGDLEQWIDELPRHQQQQWRSFHDSAILVMKKPSTIPVSGPGHRCLRWTWVKNPVDGKWIQFEQGQKGKVKKLEVKYAFAVVLYHYPEINMTFSESSGHPITFGEKNMVLRAHINLGHPPVKEFVRLLKAAGTRNDIINYVLREFHCEGCLKEKRQPTRLPASTPRTYDFNVVIGMDILFVHGASAQEEHPILNITCLGTLYSTFTMVHPTRRASALVWAAFLKCWLRVFGAPSFIIMDQGLEFQGDFVDGLESHGIQPILIDRDAPFQNGVTERRGGLFKEVYYRTRELHQPTDVTEVQNVIHEVAWALQTLTNRSGYSPAQRVFGKQPSLAMEILNDSGEYTFPQTSDAAWRRSEDLRKAARQALVDTDSKERLQRSLRARPRRAHEELHFSEGDPVYVWRQGRRGSHAKVGPCFVVLQKGDTVWVTRRGELWKCNKIQVFKMGNLEKQGLEAVPAELLKAKERLRFHSEKLGYVDVTREGDPQQEEAAGEQPNQSDPQQLPQEIRRRVPRTPRGPPEGSEIQPLVPPVDELPPVPDTPPHRPSTPSTTVQPTSQPLTPAIQRQPPTPGLEDLLDDEIEGRTRPTTRYFNTAETFYTTTWKASQD